jgi:exodeoxyribonuclease VII small subunit
MKFEEKMGKLEELVAGMESGGMKLDDMIKAFEEGRRLVSECQSELESIRTRIEKVTREGEVEELQI